MRTTGILVLAISLFATIPCFAQQGSYDAAQAYRDALRLEQYRLEQERLRAWNNYQEQLRARQQLGWELMFGQRNYNYTPMCRTHVYHFNGRPMTCTTCGPHTTCN